MRKTCFAIVALLCFAASAEAQEVRTLGEGVSPPAQIEQLEWLVGRWDGTGFGGRSQEAWLAPVAGTMTGLFEQSGDEGQVFSEILQIVPRDGSLVLRLKHFNPDLSGWEDNSAASAIEFALVAIEGETVYFSGLTYQRVAPDRLDIHLRLHQDGVARVETFELVRAP